MKTIMKLADETAVAEAAEIIKNGGLVAFPTETVYGLGANALCEAAKAKIYAAKGRPSDNPLIYHIAEPAQLDKIASDVPDVAKKLMDAFWPGPLTIIFQSFEGVGTVGVRMPKNPISLSLIRLAGLPVAAPSANVSGSPSPTAAAHVLGDLNGKIDMILDGGRCECGLESTVIDCVSSPPVILRPGGVTQEEIEAQIGQVLMVTEVLGDEVPKAPGMKYKHYAPKAEVIVVTGENAADEIGALAVGPKVGIMAQTRSLSQFAGKIVLDMGSDLEEIAANLFYLLRKCDDLGLEKVFVEGVEETGLGAAIMNRLKKAASGSGIVGLAMEGICK